MALTFLEMQTAVGELINQVVTDDTRTITLTEVKRWLNIGYKKARNVVVSVAEDYYSQHSYTTLVASQSIYTLPTNFRKMIRVEVGYGSSSSLARATKLDRNFKNSPQSTFSYAAPCYYFFGNAIELDPVPSQEVVGGLHLYYTKDMADMSTDGDTADIPLGYDFLPILYAVSRTKDHLGLTSEAREYRVEYIEEAMQMKGELLNRGNDNVDFVSVRDLDFDIV